MGKTKKQIIGHKEQCKLRIKVQNFDLIYYCILDEGHEGKHTITIDHELILLQDLLNLTRNYEMFGLTYPQYRKKLKKAIGALKT